MTPLIIHQNALTFEQSNRLAQLFGRPPEKTDTHYRIRLPHRPSREKLEQARRQLALDINALPEGFDPSAVKLLISDMDSTLIAIECIDEIADHIGIKPEIAAITEAAMRGELDFEASLRKRVALLQGIEEQALHCVYEERLRLNPGAKKLIAGLKARDIRFALVSGGFTFFTDRLKNALGLDYAHANVLDMEAGRLTGKVAGEVVSAPAKATFLNDLCEALHIACSQTIAVGDGANDLEMMKKAGLSIAYHAKPAVQAQADAALNYRGLDAILDFLA